MHVVCLGVMRKLFCAWCQKNFAYVNSITKLVPREFARRPRGLDESLRWKATQLRLFLLYTGPVTLREICPKPFYEHFMVLHTAIKILVDKNLAERFNGYAQQFACLLCQQTSGLIRKIVYDL